MIGGLLFRSKRGFSFPSVNLSRFLNKENGWQADCETLVKGFHDKGGAYIHDPRANYQKIQKVTQLMNKYHILRSDQLKQGMDGPEIDVIDTNSQVKGGLMKPMKIRYKNYEEFKQSLKPGNESHTPFKNEYDSTMLFRWPLNNPTNSIPKEFPEVEHLLNAIGQERKNCGLTMGEMMAHGLGIEPNSFEDCLKDGNVLQFPAHNLNEHKKGDILHSVHFDFSVFSIHAKGTFPGLYMWSSKGQRLTPSVPVDHFFAHGGGVLQRLTGGYIKAPFHEVYYDERVEAAKQKAMEKGESVWRVVSTFFMNVGGSYQLAPLSKFRTPETLKKYPAITAEEYYTSELQDYFEQ